MFKTHKINITETALNRLPATMKEHVQNGGSLYLVSEPENGSAFISIAENPTGHLCTFISENDIIEPAPAGLDFVKPGANVYYILPGCADEPIRCGEIENVYPDGSVEIQDKYLGDVCADVNHVFRTEAQARAAM